MKKLTEGLVLKYAENRRILILHIYFLNMDISLTMRLICLKTAIHALDTHLEGRVSQNFDTGLGLSLIACRSGEFLKNTRKIQKLPVFCSQNKTRT